VWSVYLSLFCFCYTFLSFNQRNLWLYYTAFVFFASSLTLVLKENNIEILFQCIFQLALPSDRAVATSNSVGHQPWNTINNLIAIPDQARDILMDKDISFSAPLYWQLPQIFLGDKVRYFL